MGISKEYAESASVAAALDVLGGQKSLNLRALVGWATGTSPLDQNFNQALETCTRHATKSAVPEARHLAILLLADIAAHAMHISGKEAIVEGIAFGTLPALLKAETAKVQANGEAAPNSAVLGAIREAHIDILFNLWSDSFLNEVHRERYTPKALAMHEDQRLLHTTRDYLDSIFGAPAHANGQAKELAQAGEQAQPNGHVLEPVQLKEPMYSGIMSRYLELCVNGESAQQLEAINFLAQSFERISDGGFRDSFRDRIARAFSLAEKQHSSGEGEATSPIAKCIAEIRKKQWFFGFETVDVSFKANSNGARNGSNGAQKTNGTGAHALQPILIRRQ